MRESRLNFLTYTVQTRIDDFAPIMDFGVTQKKKMST